MFLPSFEFANFHYDWFDEMKFTVLHVQGLKFVPNDISLEKLRRHENDFQLIFSLAAFCTTPAMTTTKTGKNFFATYIRCKFWIFYCSFKVGHSQFATILIEACLKGDHPLWNSILNLEKKNSLCVVKIKLWLQTYHF